MPRRKFTVEEIFDTAASDDGMDKASAARFHAFNPNGAVASLPTDFTLPGGMWAVGCEMMYSRYDNYHAKEINAFATGERRFTRWELNYHVNGAREDAKKAAEMLAEKRAARPNP